MTAALTRPHEMTIEQTRAARLWHGVVKYALSFGVVGLGGMVIDVGVFNALRLGWFGSALLEKPLTASIISASFAIVFNWIGNRYWTFRHHRRANVFAEFVEYAAVALLGLAVGLGCLAFTHYILGLTSLLADNISKNVIGLGLGTLVRFVLLRFWVWGRHRGNQPASDDLSEIAGVVFDSEDNA